MSFESLLNKTCNILKRTVAQDATSFQEIETWSIAYSNVKCRLDEAKGKELAAEGSILARTEHILFIKQNLKLFPEQHRIQIGNDQFNILLVKNAGGHDHHVELFLEIYTPEETG